MPSSRREFLPIAALLVAATGGHALYRMNAEAPGAMLVSSLDIGRQFPTLAALDMLPGRGTGSAIREDAGCRVYVVFNPSCPHCHTARDREADTEQKDRLPTIWLTAGNDSASVAFGAALRPESSLRFAADVRDRLRIQAVPAAILVGADGRVRSLWAYRGDENHEELRSDCT